MIDEVSKKQAISSIRRFAEQHIVEKADRSRFIEMVETELMSLHEGNIARYRLKLSEFEKWESQW